MQSQYPVPRTRVSRLAPHSPRLPAGSSLPNVHTVTLLYRGLGERTPSDGLVPTHTYPCEEANGPLISKGRDDCARGRVRACAHKCTGGYSKDSSDTT